MDNKQVYLIEIDADATAFNEKIQSGTIGIDKLAAAANEAKNSFAGAGVVIGNMGAATATIANASATMNVGIHQTTAAVSGLDYAYSIIGDTIKTVFLIPVAAATLFLAKFAITTAMTLFQMDAFKRTMSTAGAAIIETMASTDSFAGKFLKLTTIISTAGVETALLTLFAAGKVYVEGVVSRISIIANKIWIELPYMIQWAGAQMSVAATAFMGFASRTIPVVTAAISSAATAFMGFVSTAIPVLITSFKTAAFSAYSFAASAIPSLIASIQTATASIVTFAVSAIPSLIASFQAAAASTIAFAITAITPLIASFQTAAVTAITFASTAIVPLIASLGTLTASMLTIATVTIPALVTSLKLGTLSVYAMAATAIPALITSFSGLAVAAWAAIAPFAPFILLAAGVAAAGVAIHEAFKTPEVDFSSLDSDFQTLQSAILITNADLLKLKETAKNLRLDETLGFSTKATAEGFQKLALSNPELMLNSEALKQVYTSAALLSKQLNSDLPATIDTTAAAMTKFGASTYQADSYANIIANTLGKTAGQMTDISAAVSTAGNSANAAHLSFADFSAVLATLDSEGLKGEKLNKSLDDVYKSIGQMDKSGVGLIGMLDQFGTANLKANDYVRMFGASNAYVAQLMVKNRETIAATSSELIKYKSVAAAATEGHIANVLENGLSKSMFKGFVTSLWEQGVLREKEKTIDLNAKVEPIKMVDTAASKQHADAYQSVIKDINEELRLSRLTTDELKIQQTAAQVLGKYKLDATVVEKAEIMAINAEIQKNRVAQEKVAEITKKLSTGAEEVRIKKSSVNGSTTGGFAEELALLAKYGATKAAIEKAKIDQQTIQLGANDNLIADKEKELRLMQATAGVASIETEQLKVINQLKTDGVDKTSKEYQLQVVKIKELVSEKIKLEAASKTNNMLAELTKETAAYAQGAVAVAQFNAAKSIGLGATPEHAMALVNAQLAKTIYEKNLAAREEYQLSLMSTAQAAVEIERRKLGATATLEQAAANIQLNNATSLNTKLRDLQEETAAYAQGAVAVAQFNAAKSIGAGANPEQVMALINAQLVKSIAEKNLAAREEYQLSLMSTAQAAVEIERRKLGATATLEQAAANVRLNNTTSLNNKLRDLQGEIAAYQQGAVAVAQYNAAKSIGAGANPDQANILINQNLALSIAQKTQAAKQAYDMSLLSENAQKIETERLSLGTTATKEHAAALVELARVTKANNEIAAAQRDVSAAGLTQPAREYLKIMQDIGEVQGIQLINLKQIAAAQTAGINAKASLEKELMLAQMSTKDADKFKTLESVAPAQRAEINALLEQKNQIDKVKQSWDNAATAFVDYAQQVVTGKTSLKKAFDGFMVKINEDQIKEAFEKVKTMLTKQPVTLEGALNFSDAKARQDVTAASAVFKTYETSLMTGTDGSVNKLITGIDTSISKLTQAIDASIKNVADSLPKAMTAANDSVVKSLDNVAKSINIDANLASREGLRVKGGIDGQAFAGGKTADGTIALAQLIQKAEGDLLTRFTAFNDKYHAGTGSMHAKGLALDFSVKDASKSAEAAKIVTDLGKSLGVVLKVIDEYKDPSARATGGHIHVNFKSQADADKLLQNVTGKVGQAIDIHTQALDTHKTKIIENAQTHEAHSQVVTAHAERVNVDSNALAKHADKTLIDTSKADVMPWGTAAKSGAELTGMFNGVKIDTSQGDKTPWGASYQNSNEIAGGYSGFMGGVGAAGSQLLSGNFSGAADIGKGLFSSYGSELMGGVNIAKSLFSGDKAGALGGAISLGVTTALTPVLGPFASIAGGLVSGLGSKVFGSWTVESKNLTASIQGLSGTFKEKVIEVNKAMFGGGKRTTYTDVSDEQNKQLQAALKSVTNEIGTIGKQLGQSLIDTFKANNFRKVIDTVHEQTRTFEQQWQSAQAAMVKEGVLGANVAGVDTSITDVMAGKVSILMKSAGDGVYDKALQGFMWRPDTQKYAKEINGPIKDGLNSLISSTDWQGLDVSQTTAKLQTYLTDSFSKAGVNVPADTFKNMAEDLTGQIQNGLKFLETSKNSVNPDAPFFRNMREIVNNFDAWNAKPEEVTAFISSIVNLKDAFKSAQLSTSGITQALIDVAGGNEKIAALTQNISAYSAAFFDEGTKNATKIASLSYDVSAAFAAYGAQVPKTKADFVALTNSLDLTTESGQKAFVALMEVAPKFSELATLQATAGVGLDMFTAKLAELPNNLSSIASAMSNSLNSSVQNKVGAAQAGKDLGKTMASEVQNSLKNAYTSTILNMVMQGLVQPMIAAGVQNANMSVQSGAITSQNLSMGGANAANNMSMGGANAATGMTNGSNNANTGLTFGGAKAAAALAAGGEMAAKYIAGVTDQILATMQIIGEVMKDPRFNEAMAKITPVVEIVGAQSYTAMTDSSSFIGQDFSTNSSSTTGTAATSSTGTDNSAQQALEDAKKTTAESLKKIASNLDDFASGLEGNALKMYQLNKKYGKTDLSALGLTGQSMPDAQKFIGMSDTAKQNLATQAGVTLDDLNTDVMDYLNMLRTEEKARKDFNESLLKYTTAGENSTRIAKQIQSDAINMGASQEQIIAYIQGADLESEAKRLGTTVDLLKSNIIPSVLQGLLDYGRGLTDLQNNTLSVYTKGKKTDNNSVWIETLTLETAKLGMSAKDAAVWVENHKNELNTYAQAMGVPVDDLIKTIIPQTLQGLKSLGDGLKSLQYDMLGLVDKSFTPAQRTITELAAKYPMLDLAAKSHSMTSQQLANFYLHATDDQVAAFAKLANVSPDELLKDAGALAKAMQENEGAAKSLADSWIENFKRVTDSIDSLSSSIKTDIGTIEGKKGLSDSIAAAKTSNDAVYTAKISDINTTYEAAPQTDKTAAMLTKVAATEQAYTDSVASFNSKRAAIVADFTAQFTIQNQALKDKVFASYTGSKANILQDPEELSKRVAAANELRQALTSQYAEQAKVIQDKYKIESDNAAKLLEAAKNIANTIRDLRLDSSLSTLTKKQQLSESKTAFDELVAKAVNNNDATAAAEAQNMAKTVLGKGRDYNASSAAYTALFNDVEGGLGKIKTKFGDTANVAKTKSFEETPYAAELKTLQMNTVAQLKEIDAAGQWVKEHGTEELATGLINLGAQFGLDIGQVVDTLKLNFPQLGDKLQGVINAIGKISSPTVSDSQINEYVQGAVTRAGGVNANSVKDIADTAKYFNIAPERMASALGTDTATVSQTAAKYGQDYTSVTDSQIKSFVADATAQYGTGTKEGVTAIYNAAKQHGVTSSRLAGAIGWSNEDVLNMARQYDLPAFAEGGIVNKPTIGLFGERGPEAIMPLHKLPDIQQSTNSPEQTAALLEAIRQMIAAQRDTQSILQKINDTLKAAGAEILTEVKNLAKKTALLIGEKINSLLGK